MGDLSNKLIRQTFDGLLKTSDEDPITSTPKRLQDGVGNDLPVEVALGGMTYYGTQDFTNATVTGISGGGGSGTSGTSGTSGVDGPTGPAGPAGTSGTSGTSAAGGGGLVDTNNYAKAFELPSASKAYRSTYSTPSFTVANLSQSANFIYVGAISMAPGQTIDEIAVWIQSASTAGSMVLGLYKATTNVNGSLTVGDLEVEFGEVSTSTTGKKTITAINHTLGTTEGGVYFYAYIPSEAFGMTVASHSGGIVTHPTYIGDISSTIISKMGSYSASQTFGSLPASLTTGYVWTPNYRYPIIGFA